MFDSHTLTRSSSNSSNHGDIQNFEAWTGYVGKCKQVMKREFQKASKFAGKHGVPMEEDLKGLENEVPIWRSDVASKQGKIKKSAQYEKVTCQHLRVMNKGKFIRKRRKYYYGVLNVYLPENTGRVSSQILFFFHANRVRLI